MLLKLKNLNRKTQIHLWILVAGLALTCCSLIGLNFLENYQTECTAKANATLNDYHFKIKTINQYKTGNFQKIAMGRCERHLILNELKSHSTSLGLNYISYEFKPVRNLKVTYDQKNLCAQPVILKLRTISDAQIYDLIAKIKSSKLGLVQPTNLVIAKSRNLDRGINIKELANKEIDVFKAQLEFEVIGYA